MAKTAIKVKNSNDLNEIRALIKKHKKNDLIFAATGMFVIASLTITLLILFLDLVIDGYPRFTLDFFSNFPSRRALRAGILSAWIGSSLVLLVTFFVAVPLGIAAGVYLEEYAKKNWISDLIEINVSNLAGVPSIIFTSNSEPICNIFVNRFWKGIGFLKNHTDSHSYFNRINFCI